MIGPGEPFVATGLPARAVAGPVSAGRGCLGGVLGELRRVRDERGSATVWAICVLMLVSGTAGWASVWVMAQGTRHSAERAADSAALAATSQALRRLATQSGQQPCSSASQAAQRAGAQLASCDCDPLDCTVSVRQEMPVIGSLAERFPVLRGLGPVRAVSRAGPVGEAIG